MQVEIALQKNEAQKAIEAKAQLQSQIEQLEAKNKEAHDLAQQNQSNQASQVKLVQEKEILENQLTETQELNTE